MSGDSLIPESQSGCEPHIHDEVFGSRFIMPYYDHCYEPGFGGFGILTPDQFANVSQVVVAQQSASDYGYPGNQGFVWDCAAQSSQYGPLAQPLAHLQTGGYPENLTTAHDGLPPEIMTGSDTSPGHVSVSVERNQRERARLAAAKCRQKAKGERESLVARGAELRSENERLEAIKIGLVTEKQSLIEEVFRHYQCDDDNIQRFIQSKASEVAGLR